MNPIATSEECRLTGKRCVKIEGCSERFYLELPNTIDRMVKAINSAHFIYTTTMVMKAMGESDI